MNGEARGDSCERDAPLVKTGKAGGSAAVKSHPTASGSGALELEQPMYRANRPSTGKEFYKEKNLNKERTAGPFKIPLPWLV